MEDENSCWKPYMFGWSDKDRFETEKKIKETANEMNRMYETGRSIQNNFGMPDFCFTEYVPFLPEKSYTVIEETDKDGNKTTTTIMKSLTEVVEEKKDGSKVVTKTYYKTDFDFYKPLWG